MKTIIIIGKVDSVIVTNSSNCLWVLQHYPSPPPSKLTVPYPHKFCKGSCTKWWEAKGIGIDSFAKRGELMTTIRICSNSDLDVSSYLIIIVCYFGVPVIGYYSLPEEWIICDPNKTIWPAKTCIFWSQSNWLWMVSSANVKI